MKGIKFRVWDNRNKVMLTEENYNELDYEELSGKWKKDDYMGYPYEADEWYPMSSIQLFFELPEHDDLKVMRYSEFVDKNDKEIYEGDVLEIKNTYYLVMYNYSAFILKKLNGSDQDIMYQYPIDKMSIVGNSYENPDLIVEHHITDDLPF